MSVISRDLVDEVTSLVAASLLSSRDTLTLPTPTCGFIHIALLPDLKLYTHPPSQPRLPGYHPILPALPQNDLRRCYPSSARERPRGGDADDVTGSHRTDAGCRSRADR